MVRKAIGISLFALMVSGGWALAHDGPHRPTHIGTQEAGLERSLEARLNEVEKRQAELLAHSHEKEALWERLTLSGLLEVEANFADSRLYSGGRERESALALSTVRFGIGAGAPEEVRADLVLLFEEGEGEGLKVDEAAIGAVREVWSGRIGRLYLPFAAFTSNFATDPPTLELGETRATALMVSAQGEAASITAYTFGGNAGESGGSKHVREWGAQVTVTPAEGLQLWAGFLSDFARTGAGLIPPEAEYGRRVAAVSAGVNYVREGFCVMAGAVGPLGRFALADLDSDSDSKGDAPSAWSIETGAGVTESLSLAARVGGTREWSGHPELQFGVNATLALARGMRLGVEYLREEYEAALSAVKSRDAVVLKAALDF